MRVTAPVPLSARMGLILGGYPGRDPFVSGTPPKSRSKPPSLCSHLAAQGCKLGKTQHRGEGRSSQGLNEGLPAKDIDQFINYSIFTLINSKGRLYQWQGSFPPSLLGHQRHLVGAGQGRGGPGAARSRGRQQQRRLPHVPGLVWGRESCFPWPRAQEQGWQGWR